MQGKSAADIGDWIREHSGDAADAPEFAEFLAVQLLPQMLGQSPVSVLSVSSSSSTATGGPLRPWVRLSSPDCELQIMHSHLLMMRVVHTSNQVSIKQLPSHM